MAKKYEGCCGSSPYKCIGWGIIVALFGVFFLIANLMPEAGILKYWPIFLIAGGVHTAIHKYLCYMRD